MSASYRVASAGAEQSELHPRSLRVAVLCDFLEEQWPSMNLVGDMLTQNLQGDSLEDIHSTQVRPELKWRLSKTPGLRGRWTARNCDRLLNRFIDYPHWLRRRAKDFDLFHIVDHSYGQLVHDLPCERTVVTCHDLDTFRCVLDPQRDPRPNWFRFLSRKILEGFRRAAHVIAVSQATRDELLRYELFPPERITVIPNGLHPSCSFLPRQDADAAVDTLLGDQARNRVWLLSVGNTLPRKRLDVLLRVFAEVHRDVPEARLLRVGGFNATQEQLIRELNAGPAIVNLPFLERDVLAAVYRRATILLHTADAEGFGLPVIEALACGCPVVASDLPVLREIGGPSVCYCPVGDVPAWRLTLTNLLDERRDSDAWRYRRQQGMNWTSRFSWEHNARQTAAIYRKVMKNR